jgi:multidrug efflux pump subunit AcrB
MVALAGDHQPTADYLHQLRLTLPKRFPGVTFSFAPADIVTQILNFGLPAPIDIQVVGRNMVANRQFAGRLLTRLAQVPGIADLRVHQEFNQPRLHLDVRAAGGTSPTTC